MTNSYKSDILLNYLKQRDLYLHNAEEYRTKKLYRKSSEMLWGAITQTIKALASTSGIRIRSHNQFKTFMEEISFNEADIYYYSEFLKIERLHKNFYDEELSPSDFQVIFLDGIRYMSKLDDLRRTKTT